MRQLAGQEGGAAFRLTGPFGARAALHLAVLAGAALLARRRRPTPGGADRIERALRATRGHAGHGTASGSATSPTSPTPLARMTPSTRTTIP